MSKPARNSVVKEIRGIERTFFVTSKTSQNKALLQSQRMATLLIDVLRGYANAGKFIVHDFVVMPEHVHLLITVDESTSIERAVQLVKAVSPIARKRNWDSRKRFGNAASRRFAFLTAAIF